MIYIVLIYTQKTVHMSHHFISLISPPYFRRFSRCRAQMKALKPYYNVV
jgi:hypothetical protein